MRELALTKGSDKALRTYAAGHGRVFLSQGDETTARSFDLGFYRTSTGVYLYMGTSKAVKLTTDQIAILGSYAGDQTRPRD